MSRMRNNVFFSIWICVSMCIMAFLVQCTQQNPDLPMILTIDGAPIYIDELELLGRVALTKANLHFDSDEGQKRYLEIAPNLYESLIDLYVIKNAAQLEGTEIDEAAVDEQYEQFVRTLDEQGGYEQFMSSLGLDDNRLRELIKEKIAMEMIQQAKLNEGITQPTEEEIKAYYYSNNKAFRYPDRLRASHIFLAAKEGATEAEHARAKARAEEILKMINHDPAKNFVRLAKAYSEDTGNSPRGGDLGFIPRESPVYPPSFIEAAWALSVGEISGVVQTALGYHIIWVTDHEQSLEEAAPEIKRAAIQKAMTQNFSAWKLSVRTVMDIQRYFDPKTYTVLEEPVPDEAGIHSQQVQP